MKQMQLTFFGGFCSGHTTDPLVWSLLGTVQTDNTGAFAFAATGADLDKIIVAFGRYIIDPTYNPGLPDGPTNLHFKVDQAYPEYGCTRLADQSSGSNLIDLTWTSVPVVNTSAVTTNLMTGPFSLPPGICLIDSGWGSTNFALNISNSASVLNTVNAGFRILAVRGPTTYDVTANFFSVAGNSVTFHDSAGASGPALFDAPSGNWSLPLSVDWWLVDQVNIVGEASSIGGPAWVPLAPAPVTPPASCLDLLNAKQGLNNNGWKIYAPSTYFPATGRALVTDRVGFMPALYIYGDSGWESNHPCNLQDSRGMYHATANAVAKAAYWRSDWPVPTTPWTVASTIDVTGSEPRVALDYRGILYGVYVKGANIFKARSLDDGKTWDAGVQVLAGAAHPTIAVRRTGTEIIAAVAGGNIIATARDPGDAAPSAPFPFKDALDHALGVADDSFHLQPAKEGPGRWLLHALLNGAAATTRYWSTDDCRTWQLIPGGIAGGSHPTNSIDIGGTEIVAAFVAGTPGTIKATQQDPGDAAPSAVFTFQDVNGAPLHIADGSFQISRGHEGPGRWLLAALIINDAAISHWWSTDDCRRWVRC